MLTGSVTRRAGWRSTLSAKKTGKQLKGPKQIPVQDRRIQCKDWKDWTLRVQGLSD